MRISTATNLQELGFTSEYIRQHLRYTKRSTTFKRYHSAAHYHEAFGLNKEK